MLRSSFSASGFFAAARGATATRRAAAAALATLAALGGLLASPAAQAHRDAGPAATATPRVDARQARQQHRIAEGVRSGQLTAREAHRLQRQQHGIAHAERQAKADGVVTPRERARLDAMQDHASRSIARQRHDAQTAWHRPAHRWPHAAAGTGQR